MHLLSYKYKRTILYIFTSILTINGFSQETGDPFHQLIPQSFLVNNTEFPNTLLNGRSVVIIKMPYSPKGEREDWKQACAIAHEQFSGVGIDAIGYYYIDDILAGYDITNSFIADLKRREISNLILITQGNDRTYTISILPFIAQKTIISPEQKAWTTTQGTLEEATDKLVYEVLRSNLKKANYLLIDSPEFFEDTKIFKGRRFEVYSPDLKIEKLAIKPFSSFTKIEETNSSDYKNYVNELQGQANERDTILVGLLKSYPFKYVLFDYHKDKDRLNDENIQFTLHYVRTTEENIKTLFNYKKLNKDTTSKEVNDSTYTTTLTTPNTTVYKFYVKHTFTNDIYLGEQWDADVRWDVSFNKFVNGLCRELKIKR